MSETMAEPTEYFGVDVGSKEGDQEGDPPSKLAAGVNSGDSPSEQDSPVKKKKVWPSKYNKGPFICAYCSKKFRGLLDLTRHERTHTNEKPLVCEECGKAFGGETSLRIHKYVHRNYRPHGCTKCDKRFVQRSRLKEHMVVHTDLKPVICKVCGQGLRQKSSLKKHLRMHYDERPYKCDICPRTFRRLADCRNHQKLHADPNSRVSRFPQTSSRPRKERRCKGKVKSQISEAVWSRQCNTETTETNNPPPAVPSDSQVSTHQLNTKTSPTVVLETQAQLLRNPSPQPTNTIATNGTQTIAVTPNAMQSCNTAPLASIGNIINSIPTAVTRTNDNNILFATPGVSQVAFDSQRSVQVVTPNPPVLINASNAVTFNFTPFMFVQTPFGN